MPERVACADSTTTDSGSRNRFQVVGASALGLNATAGESNGNIREQGACQTAHGDSTVAGASFQGAPVANALSSSTDSTAWRGGPRTQQNRSQVLGLFGQPVPIPAPGCGTGAPDTLALLPGLLPAVCNADDTNGVGESIVQTAVPYGVREALSLFVLGIGGTSLLKATTAASESLAVAPDDGVVVPPPPKPKPKPERPDGPDGPGAGGPGGPGGPGDAELAAVTDADDDRAAGAGRGGDDDGRELAFTGLLLLPLAVIGLSMLIAGLGLRRRANST